MLYDGNGRPFSALDSYNVAICRPTAFAGGTANARGDDGGTDDPHTLFTVTGDVIVRLWGVCTTDLTTTTGTVAVGIANNAGLLLAALAAGDIDAGEIWNDATPAVGDTLANIAGPYVLPNGADIIETIATADVTAGNIYYICLWRPVSMGQDAAGNSIASDVKATGAQI